MEMDLVDGTEFVLGFTVDVNENRAEGYKTHTLQPHGAQTYSVVPKGPNPSGTLAETPVTSEELNGFPETDSKLELKLEPEYRKSTSGHIRTPDGELGYFIELNEKRKADGAEMGTELGTNSESGKREALYLPGFCSNPTLSDGKAEGIDSSVIPPGGTSGTRDTFPICCFISADYPQAKSGRATDVCGNTSVFGESSGDYSTSAVASAAPENIRSRSGTRDAVRAEGSNNYLTAPGTINTLDLEDAEVCEFNCSLVVIRGRSGEPTENPWSEETSQLSKCNTAPISVNNLVDVEGNLNSSFTSGEPEGTTRTCASSERTSPDPVGGRQGNLSVLDSKTAASVTEDLTSVKDVTVSQMLAGTMDTPEQVAVIHLLRTEAEWELAEALVHPQACGGKCVRTCCSELEMKTPNGHVDFTKGEGVRVGNHGFLVINRRCFSGTSSIPVYSTREPLNAGEPLQEIRSCSDVESETILKGSVANINENMSEQEMPGLDVSVARPRTLRTKPGQIMSRSCDSTPLNLDNAGYFIDDGDLDMVMNSLELGRRQSAPEELLESQPEDPEPLAEQMVSRRPGFTEFLTRSLFSWKPKDSKVTAASSGWRIFGKTSPKGTESGEAPQQPEAVRRKNLDFEPLSTTGLILEDRPANLPAKSEEEAQRHRQQYNDMITVAKRRELKDAQRKKKQIKERHRQEESIARAVVVWNTEIIPNWENMRNARRVRELWYQGLPPSIRGKIWSLAIGNELNITAELYEIFLSRAKEKWRSYSETGSLSENEDGGVDRESSLDLIKLDIFRTFPSLCIFQKGGPYHDVLHNILGAYTCYRPDVGYVQGMSFIAAVLILNLEEADAFIAFANLLNKPCQMAFFRVDHDLMLKYFAAFEVFFQENLPKLFQHFQSNSLTPDFYLIDWIFTLYSKPLPLDVACRVWDLFCRDGEEALFRTALGILRLYQDVLMQMDFIHSAQFLSRLLQNTPAHSLFTCIANTHMLSNNRRWNQVFSALMKDGSKEAGSPALRC